MKMKMLMLILILCSSHVVSQNCGTTSCVYLGRLSNVEYEKKLNEVGAIFYGEIISQSEPLYEEKGTPYRILKVKVLRVWKGIETNEVEVKFHYSDKDCLEMGELGKMMFYTSSYIDHEKYLETYWCNKYSFDEKKTKSILGDGKPIELSELEQSKTEKPDSFWTNLWSGILSFFS
jgi:hypothetical protein